MNTEKKDEIYGWDDGNIYFWDHMQNKEWCVSDEEKLYEHLLKICQEYFMKKSKGEIN